MNVVAEEVLREADGLRSMKDGLDAAMVAMTTRLRRAVFEAAQTSAGLGTSAGAIMRLPRPSAKRPLELLISPLPRRHHELAPVGAAAVIFVCDPERQLHSTKKLIAQLYGLTPAEAELAEALLSGRTLAEFAMDTGRQIMTVRKTLKRVFAKTDTLRQAELIRRLLSGPIGFRPN